MLEHAISGETIDSQLDQVKPRREDTVAAVEKWPIVVVGAGAAGLFFASRLITSSPVLILEKGPEAGRKLLLTGGGRCNLTHDDAVSDLLEHYRPDPRFLRGIFNRFDPSELREHLHRLAVPTKVEAGNRVFPRSNKASDVRDALLHAAKRKGYEIRYRSCVREVRRLERIDAELQYRWALRLDTGVVIHCQHLIFATGGASYPGTGSNGEGLKLLAEAGIAHQAFTAALTDLNWESKEGQEDFISLSGVSLQGIQLSIKGKKGRHSHGDLLFTHRGLSGPAALNLSSDVEEGTWLQLHLFPDRNAESIYQVLIEQREEEGRSDCVQLLSRWMPRKLSQLIIDRYCPELQKLKLADLSLKQWRALAEALYALDLPKLKKGRLVSGMVSRGGVSTRALHPKTMEVKAFPGLYLCGEVIDIEGDTGGYNLQAAFATAAAIAEALSI